MTFVRYISTLAQLGWRNILVLFTSCADSELFWHLPILGHGPGTGVPPGCPEVIDCHHCSQTIGEARASRSRYRCTRLLPFPSEARSRLVKGCLNALACCPGVWPRKGGKLHQVPSSSGEGGLQQQSSTQLLSLVVS